MAGRMARAIARRVIVYLILSGCAGDARRERSSPTAMSNLSARKRERLPKRAFAYGDSKGRKRLPIHDESHVRERARRASIRSAFEDEAARERARKRLLVAAKKYGIVPIGFMAGQLRSQMSDGDGGPAGNRAGAGRARRASLEQRLRTALRDPALAVLHWSDSARDLSRRRGQPAVLPSPVTAARVTLARAAGPADDRRCVHDAAVLDEPDLVETVHGSGQADGIENERLRGAGATLEASETRQRCRRGM